MSLKFKWHGGGELLTNVNLNLKNFVTLNCCYYFFNENQAFEEIVGLPLERLKTLQKLADNMNNNEYRKGAK